MVEPWSEPARGVEALAAEASRAGAPMSRATMESTLKALCEQRPCFAVINQRLTLNVSDTGTLVVEPWDDVADAVESWTAAATMAGHEMTAAGMRSIYKWCCERRSCGRTPTIALTVNVTSDGDELGASRAARNQPICASACS